MNDLCVRVASVCDTLRERREGCSDLERLNGKSQLNFYVLHGLGILTDEQGDRPYRNRSDRLCFQAIKYKKTDWEQK
ncbi:hypothetical protein [Nostoc sp.]